MKRKEYLKARVREFGEMADTEASEKAKQFYRSLEVQAEELLAIEAGLLSTADEPVRIVRL